MSCVKVLHHYSKANELVSIYEAMSRMTPSRFQAADAIPNSFSECVLVRWIVTQWNQLQGPSAVRFGLATPETDIA